MGDVVATTGVISAEARSYAASGVHWRANSGSRPSQAETPPFGARVDQPAGAGDRSRRPDEATPRPAPTRPEPTGTPGPEGRLLVLAVGIVVVSLLIGFAGGFAVYILLAPFLSVDPAVVFSVGWAGTTSVVVAAGWRQLPGGQ